jgi:hypothetical protein
VLAAPAARTTMNADDEKRSRFLPVEELAALRAEIERRGFARDPLVDEHADKMHYGLNVAVAWPLAAAIEPSYRALAERLGAMDPAAYLYPFATTHVTVLTAVSFKRYPDPSPQTTKAIDDAAERLGEFLASSTRDIGPFSLEVGAPVLARAAAFLPMKNPTGEIARVRERSLSFCRAAGGVLSDASVPSAVHCTILRFRKEPADAAAFARAFDEIGGTFELGTVAVDHLLVTLETKPYMRAGRILRAIALGEARPPKEP